MKTFFTALGDIAETPPDSAKIGKVSSPDFDSVDKPDGGDSSREKKKDRPGRFFGNASDAKETKEHKERPKLTKKISNKPLIKEKEKEKERDREDGFFRGDIPMAGIVTRVMFTYTYTRKGGRQIKSNCSLSHN